METWEETKAAESTRTAESAGGGGKKIVMLLLQKTWPHSEIIPEQAAEAAKKKHLGAVMLCGANRGRYGKLVEELWNDFTKRNDYYPEYLTEAYNLLINYKTLYYKLASRLVEDPEGV